MTQADTVVLIPHAGGGEILLDCLKSLEASRQRAPFRLWLIDNRSPDDSVSQALKAFPWIEVLSQERNLGYAGGCNAGLRAALREEGLAFAVLLNNDTVVEPDWLAECRTVMHAAGDIAAVQPRLLSIPWPGQLDYSGAAGGLLDAWGYPFALGRLFDRIEEDGSNWLQPLELAWTSGTAALFRLEALQQVGLLEESFFMHMEEIDLCWRLRSKGWRLASAPGARVHHHSGFSLAGGSPLKVRLNHRNNLRMVARNWQGAELGWRLPLRLLLEGAAIGQYLIGGRPAAAWAALRGVAEFLASLPGLPAERRSLAAAAGRGTSRVVASTYPGCVVLERYLRGRKSVDELGWLPPSIEV